MAGRGTDRYRVSRYGYGTQRKLQAGWSRLKIQMKEEEAWRRSELLWVVIQICL